MYAHLKILKQNNYKCKNNIWPKFIVLCERKKITKNNMP